MNKAIGIIGGMGPEASVYLYKMLIELSIREFGAENNDQFPEIVLDSVPVPDFISSNEKKEEALQMLLGRVTQLNKLDLSCLSIACNTVHVLLPQLQSISSLPFVSMIDAVVEQVVKDDIKIIGILGTPSTLKSKLYEIKLHQAKIKTISANKKDFFILEKAIRGVIAGTADKGDINNVKKIADNLVEQGAEGIILGCTELPLVFPILYQKPVYNSVEILARALLHRYYKNTTIGAL